MEAANVSGPIILVGEGFASFNIMSLAQNLSHKVKGMVLVEGLSPNFAQIESSAFNITPQEWNDQFQSKVNTENVFRVFDPLAIWSIKYRLQSNNTLYQMNVEEKLIEVHGKTNGRYVSAVWNERRYLLESASQVAQLESIRDIPVLLFIANSNFTCQGNVECQQKRKSNIAKQRMAEELGNLFAQSEIVVDQSHTEELMLNNPSFISQNIIRFFNLTTILNEG